MDQQRLHRALAALPWLGYGGKVLALAAVAVAIPLGLAIGLVLSPPTASHQILPIAFVGGATAASLAALAAVSSLLSSLRAAAEELRACARLAGAPDPTDGRGDAVTVMASDVKHLAAKFDSVRHRLANRHPVTGVATREPFFTAVAQDLKGRPPAATLGVIRFAQFERLAAVDRPAAEQALQVFAERLTATLGPGRPLAQVDRDCFAVWLCDPTGPKGAAESLQQIAEVLARPIGEQDAPVIPDVRIGAAIFPHDGEDGPTLLTRATAALGKAGRMANSRLAFHSEESSTAAQERFVMEQALRQAMARGELALHYQPVIDLTGGRVVGAEALLRWRHPELGSIPPARFLPVLEQSGMILEVGAWIFDRACADAIDFEELGLKPFRVGVNLSQRQFRDPKLAATVADAIRRRGVKPHHLELELTETALMEDLPHTRQVFDALAAIGVSVAIDDFGAGASSLGDLKSLPFSKLKIDRAFVTEVGQRHDSQAVCAALIELSRRLDIAVLAEGVETREEVEALRVMGCSLFQGFFFSRPLPADKFKRKVTDPEWLALLASPAQRQVFDLGERLAS
jgi:EAL domain-containing protein (putative c-di-GMP-specific phosphodiesterase class I)/GGDEF domain-containing protein